MTIRYFIFGGFILMVLAQLYVPGKMIMDKERIISEGTVFRFKTAPMDPTDPFRGKYVFLNFNRLTIKADSLTDFNYRDNAYVTLEMDDEGFARAKEVSKSIPTNTSDYLFTKVFNRHKFGESTQLDIRLPFDRLYMEESKALPAEQAFNEARRDSTKLTYGLVYILDGDYVLTDVMIDGYSLKTLAESRLAKE